MHCSCTVSYVAKDPNAWSPTTLARWSHMIRKGCFSACAGAASHTCSLVLDLTTKAQRNVPKHTPNVPTHVMAYALIVVACKKNYPCHVPVGLSTLT